MHDGVSDDHSRYLLDVQQYVEEHLCEDISPYEIAENLHVSYSHLARLVQRSFGFSLSELICRMRMNYAEELMTAYPDASITEIAARIGFGSTSYFIRQFKRLRGCSPEKFRRLLREKGIIPLT